MNRADSLHRPTRFGRAFALLWSTNRSAKDEMGVIRDRIIVEKVAMSRRSQYYYAVDIDRGKSLL